MTDTIVSGTGIKPFPSNHVALIELSILSVALSDELVATIYFCLSDCVF